MESVSQLSEDVSENVVKDVVENARMPHVVFVGGAEHPEFASALRQVDSSAHARLLCDWRMARSCLGNTSPDLVILLRNRPDGMSPHDAKELTSLAPESRFVWLLGSWCEGEAHTGQTWNGLEKIYWHSFHRWWERYRRECSGGDTIAKVAGNQLAVVHTDNVFTFEAIANSLAAPGWSAVWQHPQRRPSLVSGVAAGIWDGGQLLVHEQKSLREFRISLGDHVPVVALLDFPQIAQVQLARELGASEVLGKPWREDDLIYACAFSNNTTDNAAVAATTGEILAKPRAA